MIYFISGVVLTCVVLLPILYIFKRNLSHITTQLKRITVESSQENINTYVMSKDFSELIIEINKLIALKEKSTSDKFLVQKQLKDSIANISHDIRTPLTSIKGYFHFIKKDSLKKKDREIYENIIDSKLNRLEELLNDFYQLSLLDSKNTDIKMEKVNLSSIVQDSILEKYSDFSARGISPELIEENKNIFILGDSTSVRRVVDNLIVNTLKYSTGNITIKIFKEDDTFIFEISNPVSKDSIPDPSKIFDRFYTVDTSRSSQSSGLGLAISKELMELMNGCIKAEVVGENLKISCCFK